MKKSFIGLVIVIILVFSSMIEKNYLLWAFISSVLYLIAIAAFTFKNKKRFQKISVNKVLESYISIIIVIIVAFTINVASDFFVEYIRDISNITPSFQALTFLTLSLDIGFYCFKILTEPVQKQIKKK